MVKWAGNRLSRAIFLAALAVTMGACRRHNVVPAPAAEFLEHADRLEVLSLDPQLHLQAAEGDFHGYKILGTVVIADSETRKKLISSFEQAVAENDGVSAACFNPRHGIRAARNDKHADFVICFECDQVEVFGDVQAEFPIANSAEKVFDSVVRSNGVQPADK
jgi:hypothetical protein